jgi:hypothetical protein
MSTATILAIAGICFGVGLAVVWISLLVLISRYNRFRNETAFVFADFQAQMIDMNVRLTAAGYPPGRVTPSMMPDWFNSGLMPNGQPPPTPFPQQPPRPRS